MIYDCWAYRGFALNSHHFPTILCVDVKFQKDQKLIQPRKNISSLKDPCAREYFYEAFSQLLVGFGAHNLDEHEQQISRAYKGASSTLPCCVAKPKKPWISDHTLGLITERNTKRRIKDCAGEKILHKKIRDSAKMDRRRYLHDELASGGWAAIKRLRKGPRKQCANLRDPSGEIVGMSERGGTMAEYLENVQWQVRFASLVPADGEVIHQDLQISDDVFVLCELRIVLEKLKCGKASGHDDIPPEFWKYVLFDEHACQQLLDLCNHCWEEGSVPKTWRIAKVVTIFKKGDAMLPENYRPISLLPVGYKVFASLLHQRLLNNRVDAKIGSTQYGFRPRRSSTDALMIIRRIIDAAYDNKRDGLFMVFLDWAKAFDRIKPESLLKALCRFGFSTKMVKMIGSIYCERQFFVQDQNGNSSTRC